MAEHHAPGLKAYFLVFGFLLIMTGVTTGVAYAELGAWNGIIAVLIAAAKSTAVILVFMHVWASSRLTKLAVVSGFFFLLILLCLTSVDYISRPWAAPAPSSPVSMR